MKYIAFILNLPWTLIGLIGVLLSVPSKIVFSAEPLAIVFHVRNFWWYKWLPGKAGIRAMVNGNVIRLGPTSDKLDLDHEFIHIKQYEREPFIHPILYMLQSFQHGYRQNKYEEEAYSKSGSRYTE